MKTKRCIAIVIAIFLLISLTGLYSCTEKQPDDEQSSSDNITEPPATDNTSDKNFTAVSNFNVVGHVIYADGEPFIAKGTNVNGPHSFFTRNTLQDVKLICDVWQFNTVRVISSFGLMWQQWANTDMDAIVKAFTDKGVVVMIMTCDYGGDYPTDEDRWNDIRDNVKYSLAAYTEKWVELAETYKDNPYVWFNVLTEPGGGDWQGPLEDSCELWYNTSKHLIEAIRATGSKNIIVLDEHWWGQGQYSPADPDGYGSAVLNKGPMLNQEFDNIVYSLHPYLWTEYSYMLSYVKDCHERGLALVMGEYGAGKGDARTHRSTQSMFDVAIPYGVGRIFWAWSDDVYFLTETMEGGGYVVDIKDGVTKPTNLTWFGSLVWDDNRGLVTSPTPDHEFSGIKNGDFEDGLTGWQNTGNPRPLTIEEGGSYNGSDCARLSQGSGGDTVLRLDTGSIRHGMEYKFSAWAKSGTKITEDLTAVIFAYRTESGGEETEHTLFFGEDEWTYKETVFTLPMQLYSARVIVSRPGDIDFFFDDIELFVVTQ
jgi:mannan endo-1,4-beta-mannosidase